MKYTFILLLTFLMISCQKNISLRITETTETATVVKGNRFEGVIFSETIALDTVYEKRFTPTVEEIELAETILREKWKTLDFFRKSKDYSRQYAGVIDNNGNKTILMNFLYKKIPVFVCMSPFPSNYLTINKEALKTHWIFSDNNEYDQYLFGGFGDMTCIEINLEKQKIINMETLQISAAFDKNGKPKPFPYGQDLYSPFFEYENLEEVETFD